MSVGPWPRGRILKLPDLVQAQGHASTSSAPHGARPGAGGDLVESVGGALPCLKTDGYCGRGHSG